MRALSDLHTTLYIFHLAKVKKMKEGIMRAEVFRRRLLKRNPRYAIMDL